MLGWGGGPIARLQPTQDSRTQKYDHIHASSGIQTHDPRTCAVMTQPLSSLAAVVSNAHNRVFSILAYWNEEIRISHN
jgi:hypothetical protein